MSHSIKFLTFISLFIFIYSCKKDSNSTATQEASTGHLSLSFSHKVNGKTVVFDSLIYTNEAGNKYMVHDIQYFISDLTLYSSGGIKKTISDNKNIYYIDTDIPSTLIWNIKDDLTIGKYDSISFRFGISNQRNISNMFVNPPESQMYWPEMMGGGYHLMKFNGKWLAGNQINNFGIHLGKCKMNMSDTSYVDYSFRVSLPKSAFVINQNATTKLNIAMNIESWFKTPYIYDINQYGSDIMSNQEAMHKISANGFDVFSIE
ncbi:MAG: hypothetical protein Q8880_07600 [Bacteroidota bacterium]|nr:hypothetical protein [Bacteroidota bacterium]